ncbi:hypothetical protein [Halobacteriovorax sp. RT-2-6]|uniref:hypothetical protein n=2 Tax=Bacteriovoracia TaxID=3031419 RepID=UPI00399B259F
MEYDEELDMKERSLRVENFIRYFGEIEDVKKQIECCPKCGAKFTVTHLADHDNLYIHEEVTCENCTYGTEETLHILN